MIHATIKGLNEFPADQIPPLWVTFVSYHNMVLLGMYFILLTLVGFVQIRRGKLWDNRRLLKLFVWSMPLPVIACQFGWSAAEVGRQPWVVYHVMRTADAVSKTVAREAILFSLFLFGAIYLLLGALYLFLFLREMKHGPEPELPKSASINPKEVFA